MHTALSSGATAISIDNKKLPAAKCEECGAKVFPPSLLKPHLTRHRLKNAWFVTELKKLQATMARMRIA
jgi:uncharacterized OB-fold protein